MHDLSDDKLSDSSSSNTIDEEFESHFEIEDWRKAAIDSWLVIHAKDAKGKLNVEKREFKPEVAATLPGLSGIPLGAGGWSNLIWFTRVPIEGSRHATQPTILKSVRRTILILGLG